MYNLPSVCCATKISSLYSALDAVNTSFVFVFVTLLVDFTVYTYSPVVIFALLASIAVLKLARKLSLCFLNTLMSVTEVSLILSSPALNLTFPTEIAGISFRFIPAGALALAKVKLTSFAGVTTSFPILYSTVIAALGVSPGPQLAGPLLSAAFTFATFPRHIVPTNTAAAKSLLIFCKDFFFIFLSPFP